MHRTAICGNSVTPRPPATICASVCRLVACRPPRPVAAGGTPPAHGRAGSGLPRAAAAASLEIGGRDAPFAGQRVPAGAAAGTSSPSSSVSRSVRVGQRDQREVQLAGPQLLEQAGGQILDQMQLQLGIAPRSTAAPRQQVRRHGRDHAEAQRAGERLAAPARASSTISPASRNRRRGARHHLGPSGVRSRGACCARRAHAERRLQLLQAGAQGRLGDEQASAARPKCGARPGPRGSGAGQGGEVLHRFHRLIKIGLIHWIE